MKRIALGLACLVAVGGYVVGCSGSSGGIAMGTGASQGGSAESGASGNGGTTGNGGSVSLGGSGGSGANSSGGSGANSSGGSGANGSKDAGVPDVTFTYDGPSDDGGQEACADLHVKATLKPLDMYVMLDQSGSMAPDCSVGQSTNSKWCHAVNALAGFFKDPSAAGDRVALQYFLLSNGSCGGGGYNTPAVALGFLPQIATSLISSLNVHAPWGGTPTEGALNGIAQYTSSHVTAGRVMVGILITDGDPTRCNTSIPVLANIAKTLYNNGKGIRTFVIGMTGATFGNLEKIAVAGGGPSHTSYCSGGGSCHYYDVGNGNKAAFIAALKAIQKSALGCQYNMPTTDAGLVDPTKISVEYTLTGKPAQSLPNASSSGACGNNDGFYYDNNKTPTTITLCKTTCTKVKADSTAKVDITVPCQGS